MDPWWFSYTYYASQQILSNIMQSFKRLEYCFKPVEITFKITSKINKGLFRFEMSLTKHIVFIKP